MYAGEQLMRNVQSTPSGRIEGNRIEQVDLDNNWTILFEYNLKIPDVRKEFIMNVGMILNDVQLSSCLFNSSLVLVFCFGA
jgi:hypothetical protein